MRAVIQRVTNANVVVNGTEIGAINSGLMVLIGVEDEDTFAKKINTLKDTYFSETPEKAVEAQAAEKVNEVTEEEGDPVVEVSSNMEKYLTAIRQNSN